jgi:hypothetical protein
MTTDPLTHSLMLHVERIVRPLRATQRRKLRMRRELLAHLQSALAEERPAHPTDEAALTAAKFRLGDPANLATQLQRSVPALERLLLARIPAPHLVNAWEARSNEDWKDLPLTHAILLIVASLAPTLLMMGTTVLGGLVFETYHAAFLVPQMTRPLELLPFVLVGAALSVALPLTALSLSAKALRHPLRSFVVGTRVLALITLQAFWMIALQSSFFHGRPVAPVMLLTTLATALTAATLQLLATRLITKIPNPLKEWQSLQLAQ